MLLYMVMFYLIPQKEKCCGVDIACLAASLGLFQVNIIQGFHLEGAVQLQVICIEMVLEVTMSDYLA